MTDNDGAWFAPKRFGYGTGLPIAWQGWVVMLVYLAILIGAAALVPRHTLLFAATIVIATLVMLAICASKTRGGWRWRSGGSD